MASNRVDEVVRRLHDWYQTLPYTVGASSYEEERILIRRAVLAGMELAAEVADDVDDVEAKGVMGSYYAQLGDARATRRAIVSAIRALAGKP
jgi:hypothetical protein